MYRKKEGNAAVVLILLVGVIFSLAFYFGIVELSNAQVPVAETQEITSGTLDSSKIIFERNIQIDSKVKKFLIMDYEKYGAEAYLADESYERSQARQLDLKIDSKTQYSTYVSGGKRPYIVLTSLSKDEYELYIINADGEVIGDGVVKDNEKTIGYGDKFFCPCDTNFKEWVDNANFLIKISNSYLEEYEIKVNVATGRVDRSSFKRTL